MGTNDISINSLNKIAFMPLGNNKNGLDLRLIKDKELLQTVFSELFDYDFNKSLDSTERTKIYNIVGTNVLTPQKLEKLESTLEDIKYLIDDLADKSDKKRKKAAQKLLALGPIIKTPLRRRIRLNEEIKTSESKAMENVICSASQNKATEISSIQKVITEATRQSLSAAWVLANIKSNK